MTTATHDERLDALRDVLNGCGYPASLVAEDYPVWEPGAQTVRANLVAFTEAHQQDMSTSALLAQVIDSESEISSRWLRAAAAIAAPAAIFALPDRLTVWYVTQDGATMREELSTPLRDRGTLASRLSSLSPAVVARAKAGLQVPLFPVDVDVLARSRGVARHHLTSQVEGALASLSANSAETDDELSPKLVIGALATLMIRDKGQVSERVIGPPSGSLLDIVQQRFPGYFDWLSELTPSQFGIFSGLVDTFSSQINFAGLEPSMVSDVYEEALVDVALRHEQGTYYTPPELARQMLRALPFEHLDPQQRTVLDPACGSGTMLLAAANRLTQLQATGTDPRVWHRYLTSHLRGYDQDPLATEITKLCLLMTALPAGNSWHIDTRDTLGQSIEEGDRPFIMISNPPWRFDRASGGRSAERANVFLSWMLDNVASGGFVACVMPLGWLNRNNCRGSRGDLLERATLLEAWRLPTEVFRSTKSTIAPAVIIAQKNAESSNSRRLTLVKTARRASLQSFYESGRVDEAYLVDAGPDGNHLLRGPLTRAVEKLDDFVTLGMIAAVHNGRPRRPGRASRTIGAANALELGSLKHLPYFGAPDESTLQPVLFPDDFDSTRPDDSRVRAAKVVVSAKHFTSANPWRIQVGYDPYGLALREMFHMVLPDRDWSGWSDLKESARFYALMAVLGSGLVSCLIDEQEPTRNISTKRIQSIPFPQDQHSIRTLAQVGEEVSMALNEDGRPRVGQALQRLEDTVNRVYRLSSEDQAVISQRLEGAVDFARVVRYPKRVSAVTSGQPATIPSFGHVLDVDEEGLRVWISGVTSADGVRIPVPLNAPGWLCSGGRDFTVDGDLNDLRNASFGFHSHDWLTEPEINSSRLAY